MQLSESNMASSQKLVLNKSLEKILDNQNQYLILLKECNNIFQELDSFIKKDSEVSLSHLKILFHTLNGNFSHYNFKELLERVFKIEQTLHKLNSLKKIPIIQIRLETTELIENFNDLVKVIETKIALIEAESIKSSKNQSLYDVLFSYNSFIQDLAQQQGKILNPILVNNTNTELQIQKYQPLINSFIHLFKNAIVHGIEDPISRKRKNKNKAGTIQVKIESHPDRVIFLISDDGAGINIEKISKNFQLENLSEKELINHIFSSGFSTSRETSVSSGLGVGMNCVKYAVDQLSGTIEINTMKDEYTKIQIVIPI